MTDPDSGWRAAIYDDGHIDPLSGSVKLMVWERRPYSPTVSFVAGPVIVKSFTEGEPVDPDAGWRLPREAILAIRDGINRWLGSAADGPTEVRVLREWLAVEKERVDNVLEGNADG